MSFGFAVAIMLQNMLVNVAFAARTAAPMTENKTVKPIYAAVPARVIGAENLSALDLRLLMVIAAHDRLGANGIGCYASHTRLASLLGCHLKSLSRSLRILAGLGYVEARQHPLNGRLRVYKVIYTEFDAIYLKSGIGNKPATYEEATGNGLVPFSAVIGNQDFRKTEQDQWDAGVNILGETLIYPGEPVLIHSVETASNDAKAKKEGKEDKSAINVGAILADVERNLKAGIALNWSKWTPWLESLCGADAALDIDDPNRHRAQRILETWSDAA